jgi:hypothetical protein
MNPSSNLCGSNPDQLALTEPHGVVPDAYLVTFIHYSVHIAYATHLITQSQFNKEL